MLSDTDFVTMTRCYVGSGHELFTDEDVLAVRDITSRPIHAAIILTRRAAEPRRTARGSES